MKKTLFILCCIFTLTSWAQKKAPKWLNEARKASFSIITYDEKGNILHHGNGFFIDEEGTAVSDLTLFKEANKASIISYKNKEYSIDKILGINTLYDAIKFKVNVNKKTHALPLANSPAKVGDSVYLLPYATYNKKECPSGKIEEVITITHNAHYYTFNLPYPEKYVSCPLLNTNGEVIGFLQCDNSGGKEKSFALGIDFIPQLSISAMDANNKALNQLHFSIGLPKQQEQALLYVYMKASTLNPQDYLELLNQYILKFPQSTEGYLRRASQYVYSFRDDKHIPMAEEDLQKAENCSNKKEEVHFTRAKLILDHLSLNPKVNYTPWTVEKALTENEKALNNDSLPAYMEQRGDLFFLQENYLKAYRWFEKVQKTSMASASNTYKMVKCKEQEGATVNQLIVLMDSVIQQLPHPTPAKWANYYIERANLYMQTKAYKKAFFDYNRFYEANHGQVNAAFYYYREQAAIQFRHYKQAMEDIKKAIEMQSENVIYLLEGGVVHLRIGQSEKALNYLNRAHKIDSKSTDILRLIGLCYVQQKKITEACSAFQKAIDLGDEASKKLLKKYRP